MTATPENNSVKTSSSSINTKPHEVNYLESMFYLGYAESDDIQLYKDDKFELVVKFRTLTPPEMRDILEESSKYDAVASRVISERVETLARAIVSCNGMPLIWTTNEREAYFEKEKVQVSPLEMARDILWNKIKSPLIIDTMYEEYINFSTKVEESFSDIKKKLKNPTSSSST